MIQKDALGNQFIVVYPRRGQHEANKYGQVTLSVHFIILIRGNIYLHELGERTLALLRGLVVDREVHNRQILS